MTEKATARLQKYIGRLGPLLFACDIRRGAILDIFIVQHDGIAPYIYGWKYIHYSSRFSSRIISSSTDKLNYCMFEPFIKITGNKQECVVVFYILVDYPIYLKDSVMLEHCWHIRHGRMQYLIWVLMDLIQPESPIFLLLCVLYSQRHPFRFLAYPRYAYPKYF